MSSKLCIGVFSSLFLPVYINQVLAIRETWETQAEKQGVKVFYHVSNNDISGFNWDNIVRFDDVGDDYNSALHKHMKGLRQMYDDVDAEWYFSIGSDTYPNIKNMINTLNSFPNGKENKIIIGGSHVYNWEILNIKFQWHSGAGGYIISRLALKEILNAVDDYKTFWYGICEQDGKQHLKPACDVYIYYLAHVKQLGIRLVEDPLIYSCDYNGSYSNEPCPWKCHPKYDNLVACHFMDPDKTKSYFNYLENPEYINKYNVMSETRNNKRYIQILEEYSHQCTRIMTHVKYSTTLVWTFIKSLVENNTHQENGRYLGLVDTSPNHINNLTEFIKVCEQTKIEFMPILGNNTTIQKEIPFVDLLFLDTWHVYGHLKRELSTYHQKVKKYIIITNTTLDEWCGESLRLGDNIEKQATESGYTIDEIKKGVWYAIEEFLSENKNWVIDRRIINNNGLTIIRRI